MLNVVDIVPLTSLQPVRWTAFSKSRPSLLIYQYLVVKSKSMVVEVMEEPVKMMVRATAAQMKRVVVF